MAVVFVYGPLLDPDLRGLVLGSAVTTPRAAVLPGHDMCRGEGWQWPCLATGQGQVEGLLVDLGADGLDRLQLLAEGFGLERVTSPVTSEGQRVQATVFLRQGQGAQWALADWQARWKPMAMAALAEFYQAAPTLPRPIPGYVPAMMFGRAWSAQTAARDSVASHSGLSAEDVTILDRRRTYTNFFAFDEVELTHKRFDGSPSEAMTRGVLMATHAVMLLPYDPRRDRVLLLEQFRTGPLARGDRNPWMLEPVAGMVDAGETVEATVHREAAEEADLTLHSLHRVAAAYPSPGNSTDHHTHFIGLCDLPDTASSLGGLATENEDIRRITCPADDLFAMVRDQKIPCAPLVLLALWLEVNRARLRQS